ncbi:MAG TPA: hypothetical protein VJ728_00315 [Candidatus Binataceae bacterium]|nr:hypothetical protein [Candidatus Binataceae bacterium]
MQKPSLLAGMIVASWVSVSCPAFAAGPNAYQVTGPVLEVSNSMIAVQKGKERWEIGRDSSTKVNGDLKVGSKVTIKYRMVATSVQVKPDKGSEH